jgi:hypothetical protein
MGLSWVCSSKRLQFTTQAVKTLPHSIRAVSRSQHPRRRPLHQRPEMASKNPVMRADDAPDEAITAEEIEGDAAPQKPRNACRLNPFGYFNRYLK